MTYRRCILRNDTWRITQNLGVTWEQSKCRVAVTIRWTGLPESTTGLDYWTRGKYLEMKNEQVLSAKTLWLQLYKLHNSFKASWHMYTTDEQRWLCITFGVWYSLGTSHMKQRQGHNWSQKKSRTSLAIILQVAQSRQTNLACKRHVWAQKTSVVIDQTQTVSD